MCPMFPYLLTIFSLAHLRVVGGVNEIPDVAVCMS